MEKMETTLELTKVDFTLMARLVIIPFLYGIHW